MQISSGAGVYSDPAMRPHLQKYYDAQYAAVYERIEQMEGQEPETVKFETPDGEIHEGRGFSAEQYRAAIPSFDKWLEVQSQMSSSDMLQRSADSVKAAEKMVEYIKQNHPDTSSGVRSVFSDGDRILGYINENGGLVTHEGADALRSVAERAEKLGLQGQVKTAYIRKYGEAELACRYPDLKVTDYPPSNIPTKQEFSEIWYPDHDVTQNYTDSLAEAQEHLDNMREWHKRQVQNMNEMRAFLLQSMEEMQAENDNAGKVEMAEAETTTQTSSSYSEAEQKFLDYMNMTPEERYFELFLSQEGLTKEKLEALPPEDREEILARIEDKIKEKVKQDAGIA